MISNRVCILRLRCFGFGLLGSFFVLVLDQALKSFMIELLTSPPRVIPVTPFFNLALGYNRGISFGLLNDLGTWGPFMLSSTTILIIGFLLFWLWNSERPIDGAAISFIIGGALGNLVDRIRDGAVTDFLDFYIASYHWPAFNLADISIFIGAGILMIQSFRTVRRTRPDVAEGDP